MAEEQFPVRLVNSTGEASEGTFIFDEDNDEDGCTLTLRSSIGEFRATDWNYFHALIQLREQLEVKGWRPVCYGSSRNVYPSGMCCDMGRGLMAYRMKLGQQALERDLVQVFEAGPDVEPVSVIEQKQFHDEWLQSLGWSKEELR